jgi:hypothetical protein
MASPALNKLVKAAVLAGAAALFIYHFAMESATLRLSEPMGYPEIVYRTIAEAWPRQYQLGNFVATQDNYGPGFSTFCRLFFAMGLGPYVGARVANLVALVGAAALLVGILRSSRVSWAIVAAVTSIFFALNAGSSSIQARPDFLATLLIMACLALGRPAFLGRVNAGFGGVVLGLLGLAAFLTKPYCLLAWGVAATFPFVAKKAERRLGRAAAIMGISALVIGLGVAAFAATNPYFLTETVMFHFVHRDPSLSVFLLQARDFCILGCGLVAAVAVSIVRRSDDPGEMARTLASERRYWGWALLLGLAAMASGMGWHKGAYLTYYFHLVLPPLAVCAAFACERIPMVFSGFALIANCAVLMAVAPSLPGPDRDWDALAMDVAGQKGPIVVDYMLEPLVDGRADARVAGDGINRFAIDLPDLIGGQSAVIMGARKEVRDYVESEKAVIREGPDPKAIYMDCILFPVRPGDSRVPAHGYIAVPRNDHPLILNGYDMSRYEPLRLFVIHPFYGSQNSARQDAGKWILTIVKFGRIDDPDAKRQAARLPLVLVPPVN